MTTNVLRASTRTVMETGQSLYTILAGIAAGIATLAAVLPRIYSKVKRDNKADGTDEAALAHVDAAVAHWKTLYETAWAQVGKERALRERAEERTVATVAEVENLRGEVAALRRQVEHLTSVIQHYQSVPGATPHS